MHMKMDLSRVAVSGCLVLILAGCGGGGSSSPPVAAITPTPPVVVTVPKPTEPQAITTVPAFTYTDTHKSDALTRLNAIRASAGLGLLAQQVQIDVAAQAHSTYQTLNNVMSHSEVRTVPGFTGADPGTRLTAAGYTWALVDEVIAYDIAQGNLSGSAAVDDLASLPYHRAGMLLYGPTSAGVGYSAITTPPFAVVTIDMAYASGGAQGAPNTPAAVYPPDGVTGVAKMMLGGETPNPIPENNGAPAGYPVSLQINESKVLTVTSFTLTRPDGSVVSTKLLNPATDVNLLALGIQNFACALPYSPLAANTTYTATFVGTAGGVSLTKTWTFTTGP